VVDSASLVGQTFSHYRVLKRLGGGGMGVVYEAEDLSLSRHVALKFLPDDLSCDHRAIERFRREGRAASALNHPNICTIYEIGEQSSHHFLVMELLDGRTLKKHIAGKQLSLDQVVDLGTQIADGLDAAHKSGIIHRDIKPANIFITTRAQVKILDFGLAKLEPPGNHPGFLSEAPTESLDGPLTRPGVPIGTPVYMSPEQLRGEELDARTDIFSFGLVLYEMATGRQAFSGLAVIDAPNPFVERVIRKPREELERIICKALERDRNLRYQHASEIRTDLQRLKRATESGQASSSPAITGSRSDSRPPWFRWSVVAVLALLIAGLTVGGWLHFHKVQALTEKDTIVLADFANTTGDAVFDDALKQAVGVSLRQSPFLNVLSDEKTGAILRLMTKPPGAPLTPEIAREVCQRAGSKAYIRGSIDSMGSAYVLGLRAVNCQSGDTLALAQIQAPGKEAVLDALGKAASQLRSELGESLTSVQRFGTPVSQATTASFEALKAYSLGIRTWNENGEIRALPFFVQATELDPNFALAYNALGVAYEVLGEQDKSFEQLSKAFELRERVTEPEKFLISTNYYFIVTGEIGKGSQACDLWSQSYPRDPHPRLYLGYAYAAGGHFEQANEEIKEGLQLDPDISLGYSSLIQGYALLNRLEEARATYEKSFRRRPDFAGVHPYMYGVAFLQGDSEEMERQASLSENKPGVSDIMLSYRSDTEAFFGHLEKAREFSQRAVEFAQSNGQKEMAATWQINEALREAEFGNRAIAHEQTTSALAMTPTRDARILEALALARTGNSGRARELSSDLEKKFPLDTLLNSYWLPTINAAIAINGNKPAEAIEFLKATIPYEKGLPTPDPEFGALLYPVYVRGQAYLLLHDGSEAAMEFQKFLDHRSLSANNPLFALAHLGLARAQALEGDTDKASAAYQGFLSLWKSADPGIPILREARLEYAKLQ
jgi:serine/threonine protein kinase/tetratricopeptide (TPR) repeat protein